MSPVISVPFGKYSRISPLVFSLAWIFHRCDGILLLITVTVF